MSRILRSIEKLYQMTVVGLMGQLQRWGWFKGESWAAWFVVAKAMFGLPLDEAERAIFADLAGGRQPPTKPIREAWLIVGRRGGKSAFVAFLAFFFSTCVKYRLAPGERGVVMIVASDRKQARVIFRYIQSLFALAPFVDLVERQTQEAIFLRNGLVIEIHTSNFRSIRGYTVVCFLGDEVAFWSAEGANPDAEILAAARPATVTVPTAMVILISSPHARRGELWKMHQKHFGKDSDDVLVIQAPSRVMNPTLPEAIVAQAYADDEAVARAEYGAEFRTDVETFIRREAVEACVVPGRFELPVVTGSTYRASFDGAGGSGGDAATCAIAHTEQRGERLMAVLDVVIGVTPPFSPESVVADFCVLLTRYHITHVSGDRWAGEWPREQFLKAGIAYEVTDKSKSEHYKELLPAINSGSVELLDLPILIGQLCGLERRTARGGKDSIDHGPNSHDDYINAAAIVLNVASREGSRPVFSISGGGAGDLSEIEEQSQEGTASILRTTARQGSWFPGESY